ncbi:MAG: hypothetical protein QM790_02270 [Nibricoccus sp.]
MEGSIAQATAGKNVDLLKSIELQIKNANKLMEIYNVPGQVIWKPYVDLSDLTTQTKAFVGAGTVWTGALAHGLMTDPSDASTWTGQVGINGQAVGFRCGIKRSLTPRGQ